MSNDCEPHEYAYNNLTRTFYVQCTAHPHERAAVQKPGDFRCARGNEWLFLVRERPLHLSALLNLTDLLLRLRGRLEAAAATGEDYTVEVGLLKPDGPLAVEPLTMTYVRGTGRWQQDSENYSIRQPQYTVTGADGTEYLRFGVTIVDA